jgi:hypothetical protein
VARITQACLLRLFDLNFETGELIWKRPTIPQIRVGIMAGRRHSSGNGPEHTQGSEVTIPI